ncbi:MAG: AI-2E family transporter [Bacilli bacterium]|nr:AI-2E family transporter [Bacilli bacterium]
MIKNKLDYKLVNITLIILSIYLIYQTKDFWVGILSLFFKITFPFFIAFVLAYAFFPFIRKLMNRGISKGVSVFIVIFCILVIGVAMISLITPLLIDQTTSLFNGIVSFLKELSLDYNINFKDVQNTLSSSFKNILEILGSYISNGAINVISVSVDYISKFFIVFAAFIYFLIDMDKIREFVKVFLKSRSKKMYDYVVILDNEMESYLSGFMKIVIISFFEYSIIYTIIGHPNAVLLGGLASFGNLIPYFGGIITNTIAAITAFVISPELFIRTCIVFIIFSSVDGYLINPMVYGKTNKVHPLVVITSVFAGGILFGILGIIISLPLSILIIATIKFFKSDIIKIKEKRSKK